MPAPNWATLPLPTDPDFGRKLAEWRHAQSPVVSQRSLARALRTPYQQIARYEAAARVTARDVGTIGGTAEARLTGTDETGKRLDVQRPALAVAARIEALRTGGPDAVDGVLGRQLARRLARA